jgi:protein-S-isoprenylcysteine O-methyltransferase Ste14
VLKAVLVILLATNADHQKLLGGQLPTTPIGWILLLSALWAGLAGLLAIWLLYTKWVTKGEEPLKDILSGLILPVGWLTWSIAFLYAELSVTRALIVGAGSVLILGSGARLYWRSRRKPTAP